MLAWVMNLDFAGSPTTDLVTGLIRFRDERWRLPGARVERWRVPQARQERWAIQSLRARRLPRAA